MKLATCLPHVQQLMKRNSDDMRIHSSALGLLRACSCDRSGGFQPHLKAATRMSCISTIASAPQDLLCQVCRQHLFLTGEVDVDFGTASEIAGCVHMSDGGLSLSSQRCVFFGDPVHAMSMAEVSMARSR